MKNLALLLMNQLLFSFIVLSQQIPESAAYFGQSRPGSTPVLFAPQILNTSAYKAYIVTISPDGSQMFFDNQAWPERSVWSIKYKKGKWTNVTSASFSQNQLPGEPSFSVDGKRVYYYAFPNLANSNNTDIYYSEIKDSVWSKPVSLGGAMKTNGWEFHPCVVKDTSVYFTNGNGEICRSQYKNGVYQKAVILSYPVNYANLSQVYADAYVAPDESYMIFRSYRTGGIGYHDLYISYRKPDGSWTNPKNLGKKINSRDNDGEGDITPDGKYMTYNRNNNLYWVSTSFIDSLKQTNNIPYLKSTLKNQTDTVGHLFKYTLSEDTFIDDDGNNTLIFSATLNDGSALPSWLSFNPITLAFSGTPNASGAITIKITATDAGNATATASFMMVVNDHPTSVNQFYENNIRIYPNPTNSRINILFGKLLNKKAIVEISNIEGKVIQTNSFCDNAVIDLSNNPKGIYLIKLFIDNEIIVRKICME